MLKSDIKPYFYAITYALSALTFMAATNPEIWEDYLRILALAMTVLILIWTAQAALLYQQRWNDLPPARRQRMVLPSHVWGMGGAYAVLLIPQIDRIIGYFGETIHILGLPVLIASYALSSWWLWPLVRHQRKMKSRENDAHVVS